MRTDLQPPCHADFGVFYILYADETHRQRRSGAWHASKLAAGGVEVGRGKGACYDEAGLASAVSIHSVISQSDAKDIKNVG